MELDLQKFVTEQVVSDHDSRRSDALKDLEYYQGDQTKHIPKNRDESSEHFSARPKIAFNLTRKIVDAKSKLYERAAKRDSDDSVVRQFWKDVRIDLRMREISPIIRLCGTVMVFPDYVEQVSSKWWQRVARWFFRQPSSGVFRFNVYTPNQVAVLPDPDAPDVPQLVAVIYGGTPGAPDAQIWSAEKVWQVVGGALKDANGSAHGFGRIPMAVLRQRPSWTRNFWGAGESGNIVPQNEEINRLCSSLQWLVICQSHGQWVAKNAPKDWKPKIGTDQIVKIYDLDPERQGSLDLLAPQSDVSGLKDTINWMIDRLCEANQVPAGAYRLDVNRQSGVSLNEKRIGTWEELVQQRPVALEWEQELASLARLVYSVRVAGKVPDGDAQIRVNFREPEMPQPVADRVQREQHELAAGLTTGPKILQRHDPDLSDEEALAIYEENLAFNREHGARNLEAAIVSSPASPESLSMADAALKAAGLESEPGAPIPTKAVPDPDAEPDRTGGLEPPSRSYKPLVGK